MITLNLVPPAKKISLRNTRIYEAIKEALTLIFLFTSIIAIMLWVSRYYLEKELSDLTIQNSAYIKSNEDANQKINALNSQITAIYNIQNNFISNRALIEDLSLIAPGSIAYKQIKFYRMQNLVELNGTAATRNDLLEFKNNLEKSIWIKSVDLPMTALINKEQNDFMMRLEIDPKKLPQL
jgi:Tfp pilus assembly protein PilN